MKQLYLECNMGASADMLMSALYELLPNPDLFMEKMNKLGLPGITFIKQTETKCGINGTHVYAAIDTISETASKVPALIGTSYPSDYRLKEADAATSKETKDALEALQSIEGLKNVHIYTSEPDFSHAEDNNLPPEKNDPPFQKQELIVTTNKKHSPFNLHSLFDITEFLESLPLSESIKGDVISVCELLAEAEEAAHGTAGIEQFYFHGTDKMADIAAIIGVCFLMEELEVERITASPVHVGYGQIQTSYGILPVPTPAAAYLLKGIPFYGGNVEGELCTPTGAALLKYFVEQFGSQPVMTVEKIGYGMGTKDLKIANCIRTFLGKTPSEKDGGPNDSVIQLSCNLDDMTGEEISFACEQIWNANALDVWLTPIQVKKNRPGQMLTCLCKAEYADKLAAVILKHTTTWGVRKTVCERYCMKSEKSSMESKYGTVAIKQGYGYGIYKTKPEYEDAAQIAKEEGIPLREVFRELSQ